MHFGSKRMTNVCAAGWGRCYMAPDLLDDEQMLSYTFFEAGDSEGIDATLGVREPRVQKSARSKYRLIGSRADASCAHLFCTNRLISSDTQLKWRVRTIICTQT